MISRVALAGEGARGIVAGSRGVTSVFRAFINIGTLVPAASITRQAGTAECAASVVNAPGLASRSTGMTAILTGVGRWGDQDASVPVICKLITTPALTPVASRQVDTHGVGATVMGASCTFIYIHTTPSVSLVPRGTLTSVVYICPWMAPSCNVTCVAPIIARIHWGGFRVLFNWANLIGHSKSKQAFFFRVQGKDSVYIQLPGGGDGPVSGGMPACLVSDVLVDAVGSCLVDSTEDEGVVSGTCGGHS